MRGVFRTLAVAALVAVASCGGATTYPNGNSSGGNGGNGGNGGTGGTSGSTSNSIALGDDFFNPSTTTVGVGTTVTWTWSTGTTHNVTFADGTTSGDKSSGTYTRTFNTAGTYSYQCTIHTGMTGTIVVQ
ncbi:MAG TPA: plastocyanin/azurin family copper-binding protein [Gemmatimonadaceae bacterium]